MSWKIKVSTVEEFLKLTATRKRTIVNHSCCNFEYLDDTCILDGEKCTALIKGDSCDFLPIVIESYRQYYNLK